MISKPDIKKLPIVIRKYFELSEKPFRVSVFKNDLWETFDKFKTKDDALKCYYSCPEISAIVEVLGADGYWHEIT